MEIRQCSSIPITSLIGSLALWNDSEMGYVMGISISLDKPHHIMVDIMDEKTKEHHSSYPVKNWEEWSFQLNGHPHHA